VSTTTGSRVTASGLVVPLLVGSSVAVVLGVYGGLHQPTGRAVNVAGFSDPGAVKSWLATVALAMLVVQVVTAAGMWGRLGVVAPRWSATVHRWSGRLALLTLVPVAVHCLYALGFQDHSARTLVHSLAGCFFFGAVTTKLLALSRPRLPGWTLPLLGGLVTVALVGLWLSSALWFFSTFGLAR
jgi:uncharacterized membrane protein HdeD (DUF308 family)